MPVNHAEKHSRTNALWQRITRRCIKIQNWFWKYEIDIFLFGALIGGTILFVMAMRAIADAT